VRDGNIEQLSFDHSLAWELVRRKQLTFEQARSAVPNNVITRSLGPEPDVETDIVGPHPVKAGDTFVLCSDGLSGQVADADIGLLADHLPAQEACQHLVDMANLRGGPDNITLIIARVGHPVDQEAGKRRDTAPDLPAKSRDYSTISILAGTAGLAASAAISITATVLGPGQSRAHVLPSIAVGVVGMLCVVAGYALRRFRRPSAAGDTAMQEPLPYRPPIRCVLDKAALDRFGARLNQLRAVAVEQAWNVDWTEFFSHRNTADKLAGEGNLAAALRHFCDAQHLLSIGQRRFLEQTQALLRG
jgi:protein phosphatase